MESITQSPVDLIILDLEMPEMDGLQTLKALKTNGFDGKVIVFSSASKRGAEITLEALGSGASDFVAKPNGEENQEGGLSGQTPSEKIRGMLEPKIYALFKSRFNPSKEEMKEVRPSKDRTLDLGLLQAEIIVIGSSTGGPNVLESIFSSISAPCSLPIVIAQHMPPLFTATLAERISKLSGIPTREAEHNEPLLPGKIYVAPGNYHLTLKKNGLEAFCQLDQSPHVNFVRPAVDPLFESAAGIFGNRCLGIILTGMGSDGKAGCEAVKRQGGAVLIQNQESCVVFGMPGAVQTSGAFDQAMTPPEITSTLNQILNFKERKK